MHLHLDGEITVDIAKKLAELQKITLPTYNDHELLDFLSVKDKCKDLDEFLQYFKFPLMLLQTKEGISEAVYLFM